LRVITELELRDLYRREPFTRFELPAGAGLTPAAAQFLSDRRIIVNERRDERSGRAGRGSDLPEPVQPLPEGGIKAEESPGGKKREYETHLRGARLVIKNHPRIRLRGQLDHLQAETIIAIIDARQAGLGSLAGDLQWLLDLLRRIMRAEVTGEALPGITFCGMDGDQIRAQSHHPEEHLGVRHFFPEAGHGMLMGRVNLLRTLVRQAELAAVDAFCRGDQVEREDLITALNRASSAVYIMMCRLMAGSCYRPAAQE